jgi:uncharacterized glyoxalase superfamily protein PhnB
VLDFYRDAFGAVIHERLVDASGRVGHSELTIGRIAASNSPTSSRSSTSSARRSRGGATCSFTLEVPDVDAAFARAVALGRRCAASRPISSTATAPRTSSTGRARLDALAKSEDLSPDEYADAAAAGGYEVPGGWGAADPARRPHDHQKRRHGIGDLYYFNLPVETRAGRALLLGGLGWQLHDGHIANIAAPPGSVSDYYPDDVGARLWFVVDDIDAAVAKVRELGGPRPIRRRASPGGARTAPTIRGRCSA